MKINCGPTMGERHAALREWHKWFAWYPVRIGSKDCRWMETVERRARWDWFGSRYNEYKEVKK